MELIKTTPKGTMVFQLTDGRQLLNYKSGYVRINAYGDRLYQINPFLPWEKRNGGPSRKLIKCPIERMEFCVNWVKKNVKPGLWSDRKRIEHLEFKLRHFENLLKNMEYPEYVIYNW